jgi:hypothetical protein
LLASPTVIIVLNQNILWVSWDDSGWFLPCSGKEYSKGDSRYVARDAATVTVEGITAVLEGPASLLAVYVLWSSDRLTYLHSLLHFLYIQVLCNFLLLMKFSQTWLCGRVRPHSDFRLFWDTFSFFMSDTS